MPEIEPPLPQKAIKEATEPGESPARPEVGTGKPVGAALSDSLSPVSLASADPITIRRSGASSNPAAAGGSTGAAETSGPAPLNLAERLAAIEDGASRRRRPNREPPPRSAYHRRRIAEETADAEIFTVRRAQYQWEEALWHMVGQIKTILRGSADLHSLAQERTGHRFALREMRKAADDLDVDEDIRFITGRQIRALRLGLVALQEISGTGNDDSEGLLKKGIPDQCVLRDLETAINRAVRLVSITPNDPQPPRK